jgi:hypothetical protein
MQKGIAVTVGRRMGQTRWQAHITVARQERCDARHDTYQGRSIATTGFALVVTVPATASTLLELVLVLVVLVSRMEKTAYLVVACFTLLNVLGMVARQLIRRKSTDVNMFSQITGEREDNNLCDRQEKNNLCDRKSLGWQFDATLQNEMEKCAACRMH